LGLLRYHLAAYATSDALQCSPEIEGSFGQCEIGARTKKSREKRSGWKEENHIKEVDQTPKTMIIEGSR
jgi:hypothetical protein